MSKRFSSCGPNALTPTQSLVTTTRKFQLIASTTPSRTRPLVVQPVTTSVSTPLAIRTLVRIGAEEGRSLRLAHDQFSMQGSKFFNQFSCMSAFGQVAEARRLFAPHPGSLRRGEHRAGIADRGNVSAGGCARTCGVGPQDGGHDCIMLFP